MKRHVGLGLPSCHRPVQLISALPVLWITLLVTPLAAQQGDGAVRSLREIGTVMLDAGFLGDQLRLGLDTTAILTRMDVQLRRDRIPVGRLGNPGDLAGNALLTWKVTFLDTGDGAAFSVELELMQLVTSPFSKESFFATTWQARGRIGWSPTGLPLRDVLLADLEDQLLEFVSAYRSVNP